MTFKNIENTSIAKDIYSNLASIHKVSRFKQYSLKGLHHAYKILRSKSSHKFLNELNEKELNLFMDSYNSYISIDNIEAKNYKVLLHKPTSINDIMKIEELWKKRKPNGGNHLMDLEAENISKSELASYLQQDYCVYLISNESCIIEKEIHNIDELLPFTLMPLPEASKRWGLGESTLRGAVQRSKILTENIDYRKTGRIYLITEHAMRKLYGEPKVNDK